MTFRNRKEFNRTVTQLKQTHPHKHTLIAAIANVRKLWLKDSGLREQTKEYANATEWALKQIR